MSKNTNIEWREALEDGVRCRVCGGEVGRGIAFVRGIYGCEDFGDDLGEPGTTMSEGPANKPPIECLKCVECGHSFTLGGRGDL